MKECIDRVHEKSGKNRIATFFDIVQCSLRYGAGYYDYLHGKRSGLDLNAVPNLALGDA